MRKVIGLAVMALTGVLRPSAAATVVDVWTQVQPPPAPALATVTVTASDTALLLLDIESLTCNQERRPRCVDAVPGMATFLTRARNAHLTVLYSNTGMGTRDTILPPVRPQDDEPIVKSTVNKFFNTRLDEELKARNIKTVITCGTTAFGAVLHTATAAAQFGYKVIVPADCMPGGSLYEEQAVLWSLLNGPGTAKAVTATTLDSITITAVH